MAHNEEARNGVDQYKSIGNNGQAQPNNSIIMTVQPEGNSFTFSSATSWKSIKWNLEVVALHINAYYRWNVFFITNINNILPWRSAIHMHISLICLSTFFYHSTNKFVEFCHKFNLLFYLVLYFMLSAIRWNILGNRTW